MNEFGNKASIVSTRSGVIVGALGFRNELYWVDLGHFWWFLAQFPAFTNQPLFQQKNQQIFVLLGLSSDPLRIRT